VHCEVQPTQCVAEAWPAHVASEQCCRQAFSNFTRTRVSAVHQTSQHPSEPAIILVHILCPIVVLMVAMPVTSTKKQPDSSSTPEWQRDYTWRSSDAPSQQPTWAGQRATCQLMKLTAHSHGPRSHTQACARNYARDAQTMQSRMKSYRLPFGWRKVQHPSKSGDAKSTLACKQVITNHAWKRQLPDSIANACGQAICGRACM
jgi:hypothetical protein